MSDRDESDAWATSYEAMMEASFKMPGDKGRRDGSGEGSLVDSDGRLGERRVALEERSSLWLAETLRAALRPPSEVGVGGDEGSKITWVGLMVPYGIETFETSNKGCFLCLSEV